MGIFDSKPPWYSAGLAFECGQCGRCCAGPEEGFVWIDDREITLLSQFLGVDEKQVRQRYVRRSGGRTSLKEDGGTHDCVFLVPDATCTGKTCAVYEARPAQCRTWPFWPTNLASPDAWSRAAGRCPGINCGRLHPLLEIQARRDATEQ